MSFTHALSPCELHPATLTTLTILTLTLTLSLTFHISPFTLTFTLAALPAPLGSTVLAPWSTASSVRPSATRRTHP